MTSRIAIIAACAGMLISTAHAGDSIPGVANNKDSFSTSRSSGGFKIPENESPRPNFKRPGVAVGDVNGDGLDDLRKRGNNGGNNRNNALTDGILILRY